MAAEKKAHAENKNKEPETIEKQVAVDAEDRISVESEKKVAAPVAEASYTAAEYANHAATVFGEKVSPDIVRAAFACAGKKSAPRSAAIKLVRDFYSREVK